MHFDEVYHPRTATEFLQDWRYGISHDIYEWTHPHLAKYAMALGLVAFGEDKVGATSELGVAVVDAAIEPRRDDGLDGDAAGDRLWVATGSEVRAYDLATRASWRRDPATGAVALAFDDAGASSSSATTTAGCDGRRRHDRPGGRDAGSSRSSSARSTTDRPAARDRRRRTAVVALGRPALDRRLGTGDARPSSTCRARDLAPAGTGSRSSATPSEIDDPARSPRRWPTSSAATPARSRRAPSPGDTVVARQSRRRETRPTSSWPSATGRCPASSSRGRAGSRSRPRTASRSSTRRRGRRRRDDPDDRRRPRPGARDRPRTTRDLRDRRDRRRPEVRRRRGRRRRRQGRPGRRPDVPAAGRRGTGVIYDQATRMVHILGLGARRRGPAATWTVYVIEPHAQRGLRRRALPPASARSSWRRPSPSTRPRIASSSCCSTPRRRRPRSRSASTPSPGASRASSPAPSWRRCLYVLARLLFQRRLVAVLVGAVRARRRDVLRPAPDRHERRLRGAVHRRGVHGLRRACWTGWWRGTGRVLAGACRSIGAAAGPRARLEVGRRVRHRRRWSS